MKKTLNETIKNITKISSKFPKTINEALDFNDEQFKDVDDVSFEDDEQIPVTPEEKPTEEPQGNASEKARKLIDDIRKMSLRAMAELADTPEDENYIMLKKVWSMTDRKPEQEKNNLQ